MDVIQLGTILPGYRRVSDQNINETYHGFVLTDSGEIQCYIKRVPSLRELYVECACALLGIELGLPIPKPYIALLHHDGDTELCYASEDTCYPSLRRTLLCQDLEKLIRDKLFKSQSITDLIVFDEWIANTDRNIGNILYDGSDCFSFIDHGLSLIQGLMPNVAVENKLGDCAPSILDNLTRYRYVRKAERNIIPMFKAVDIDSLAPLSHAPDYLDQAQIAEITFFLKNRLDHLLMLFKHRLRLPIQGSLL